MNVYAKFDNLFRLTKALKIKVFEKFNCLN